MVRRSSSNQQKLWYNALVESRYSLPIAFPRRTKDALPLAKKWLDECGTSHSRCNIIQERRTPSRLLLLSNDTIKLCLSEELPECPKYATLSHCWGSLVLLNLKKSTIQLFRESVPSEAICKTFEHAIYITRYIGLKYLWIDSLCIIQDDTDDWVRESANMSSVYRGSSLNIAASFAPNGTFGCFVDRGLSDIWRILVRTKVGNEEHFFECLPPEMYRRGLTEMPLLQRRWVVQERILAPRMLHFTSTQVFWECFEKVACEVFPTGFPKQRSDIEKYFHKRHFVGSMWPEVVELYSKCKLTYSEDKMVAISGLAQHIKFQTNREYVAGLWREGLESQLCWRRRDPRQQRPPLYRAPTWSWASIDGWVRHVPVSGAEHYYIKILEVYTSPSGSNPLGAISEASMRL
jgi:Heterokaryon incompatibility protein (HET)